MAAGDMSSALMELLDRAKIEQVDFLFAVLVYKVAKPLLNSPVEMPNRRKIGKAELLEDSTGHAGGSLAGQRKVSTR